MIEPHSATVDANGLCLHYLGWEPEQPAEGTQEDADAIPLVLLHGLGATAASWQLLAERLCEQHFVLAFDLRGHGQSDKPESGYDLATLAEDVVTGMAGVRVWHWCWRHVIPPSSVSLCLSIVRMWSRATGRA
jgi:pimeloyl-ACP methyl ester carboxylesterase